MTQAKKKELKKILRKMNKEDFNFYEYLILYAFYAHRTHVMIYEEFYETVAAFQIALQERTRRG